MLGPEFDLIPDIGSKIRINNQINKNICCFCISLFDINCPSPKLDKCIYLYKKRGKFIRLT